MGRKNRKKVRENDHDEEEFDDEDNFPTEEELDQERQDQLDRLLAIHRHLIAYRDEHNIPIGQFLSTDNYFDFVDEIFITR